MSQISNSPGPKVASLYSDTVNGNGSSRAQEPPTPGNKTSKAAHNIAGGFF